MNPKASLILANLNEAQRQAVTTVNGPVLVLAGAGSGKTKTLVHRLAYLIAAAGVQPERIIGVTFTNQAAKEMRQRIQKLLGVQEKPQPLLGTFHSLSARFLRREAGRLGYPSSFSIYDQDDQLSLIREALKDQGVGTKVVSPQAVLAIISRAKSELITADNFLAWAQDLPRADLLADIYRRYQKLLIHQRAFDFDDLLMQMIKLWQSDSELLAAYQERFHYLLVDEYQDVNKAQYIWIKLLADKRRNLCVVGDDWQSIYSWRGADFGNILRFHEDYPQATIIKLEQNYRSTKVIIQASNAIMAKAQRKADKTLWTANPRGQPIKVVAVEDENAEAMYVVSQIIQAANRKIRNLAGVADNPDRNNSLVYISEETVDTKNQSLLPEFLPHYQGNGEDLRGFAVLYRTNAQSRALEEACLKANLPYQLIGGTRFYERKEIKDVLAYLRLMVNPYDAVSFRRALLATANGLGIATIETILKQATLQNESPLDICRRSGLGGERGRQLQIFAEMIEKLLQRLKNQTVSAIIDAVLHESGLGQELLEQKVDGQARYENILELKTVAAERAAGKGIEALENFLAEVSLWQDQDNYKINKQGITLMTLHAAKGLEFDTVFLVGLEEGLFPHASAFDDPRELDEERRLAYVGLTRARHQIYCLYCFNRRLFGSPAPSLPSRFITELPPECVEEVVASGFI